jgi:TRAP transporter TAXI family solute receptor
MIITLDNKKNYDYAPLVTEGDSSGPTFQNGGSQMKKALAVIFSLFFFAALAPAPAPAAPAAPATKLQNVRLKMGTVWQTSGSYPGYVAYRDIIVANNPDMQIAVVEMGGAVITEDAIVNGQVDFGNSDAPDLYMKYNGIGKYAGQPKADMLRALWVNQHQPNTAFVVASSGVKSITELNGKPYGVLIGSIVGDTFRAIMEQNGIKPAYYEGEPGALSDAVSNKRIIGYCKSGVKEASIQQIALTTPITILPIPNDILAQTIAKYRGFHTAVVPAGSYPGQTQNVPTWTSASFIVGTNKLSEEVVYRMVKSVYENRKQVLATVSSWNLIEQMPQNIVEYGSIPLHPGTVRFLKEQGVTVPDSLLPPEMKK